MVDWLVVPHLFACLLPTCRSNLEKSFHLEEVYDGDISVVQIATCKANSEKVIIKSFKRDKLQDRVDLQNKVGGGSSSSNGYCSYPKCFEQRCRPCHRLVLSGSSRSCRMQA